MPSSPIRRAVAVCLVIATCAVSAWLFFFTAARETRRNAADFAEAVKNTLNFTPKVIVDRTVIFQESTPVLELVSTKRRFTHRMNWKSTWLGSTKVIELTGEFTASAGFDLREPFTVEFDSRSNTVRVRHPQPRLLSVQLDSVKTSQDSGWWNAITDEDRTSVLNAFTTDARKLAETRSPLLDDARVALRHQLSDLLLKTGLKIEFEETASLPSPEKTPLP